MSIVSAGESTDPDQVFNQTDSEEVGSLRERLLKPFRPSEEDPLETDRPDFTEASSVISPGRVQLESGYTFTSDRSGSVKSTSHCVPQFVWRFGLVERIEGRIVWDAGYLSEREFDRSSGVRTKRSGGTDLDLGIKTALLEPDDWIPETALISTLSVPAGAEEFRVEHTQPKFNLLYGWDITEKYSLAGSTGLQFLHPDDDSYVQTHQSITNGYQITEKFGGYLEWFGIFTRGAAEGGPQHYLDGGFTYKFTPNFQADVRVGVGLNEAADDLFTGTGYAIRW